MSPGWTPTYSRVLMLVVASALYLALCETVASGHTTPASFGHPGDKHNITQNTSIPRTTESPWLPTSVLQNFTVLEPEPASTSSQKPHTDPSCSTVHLTELQGGVQWTGNDNSADCSWLISLNGSYGLVVTVEEVYLDPDSDDALTVYSGPDVDPDLAVKRLRGHIAPVSHILSRFTSVFLVHNNKVLIRVVKAHKRTQDQGGARQDTGKTPSFKLSYTALAADTMPPEVRRGRYNCSRPYVFPAAFKCDVAWQCLDGEDELPFNCPYTNLCRPGFLFKRPECRSFKFPSRPISAVTAIRECGVRSSLYYVPHVQDPSMLRLTVRVVELSGFEEIVVAMRRVEPVVEELFQLYRFLWEWQGSRDMPTRVIYSQPDPRLDEPQLQCGVVRVTPWPHLKPVSCTRKGFYAHACAFHITGLPEVDTTYTLQTNTTIAAFPSRRCSDGSFTHPFLPCPVPGGHDSQPASLLPQFQCQNGIHVHYSLLCDGHDDCGDSSDEETCEFLAGYFKVNFLRPKYFLCQRKHETIRGDQRCDGRFDCHDRTDEAGCIVCQPGLVYCDGWGCLPNSYIKLGFCRSVDGVSYNVSTGGAPQSESLSQVRQVIAEFGFNPQSAVLNLDGYGAATLTPREPRDPCPETHFECSKGGLCVPAYLLHNGQVDCPYPHDEEISGTDDKPCPGFYRCYGHPKICLHDNHLCDGIYQCPLKDDERYCNLTSPPFCQREGFALACNQTLQAEDLHKLPWVRYLDLSTASASTFKMTGLDAYLDQTAFLNLSSCGLELVDLSDMNHLRVLDVSFNHLHALSQFNTGEDNLLALRDLPGLTHLNLSHNYILPSLDGVFDDFAKGTGAQGLLSLSVQHTGVSETVPGAFRALSQLAFLDMRDNRIQTLDKATFAGLTRLQELYTDDPKLCCAFLYLHNEADAVCRAPEDELSSCDDILRSDFFRGFLWSLSVMAITGNVGVLIYRLCLEAEGTSRGFRILVVSLCVSDFLMGVYLMMIGAADLHYKGIWEQAKWRRSTACKIGGFLALLSSEVSALIVCLITLDRLLVLRFPLKRHLHLSTSLVAELCVAAWLLGLLAASVPLLPATAHWEFYSQTNICLPLPITRQQFPGRPFAFAVFIVLNFVLFVLIGVGQTLIYHSIRSTTMVADSQHRQMNVAVARRLFYVVFSDFCCWFPISLTGIMAASGTPIPSVVNVWAAVLVMPLNSAVNPFLYTLGTLLERRRAARVKERVRTALVRIDMELATWPQDKVLELFKHVQRHLKVADSEEVATIEG